MNFNIKIFSENICLLLGISIPKIKFGIPADCGSKTMLACYSQTDNTVYIKPSLEAFDQAFAVSHELRHIWQNKTDKDLYFSEYKNRHSTDLREYNLLLAEIDANAFATIMVVNTFKQRPLFQGFDKEIVAMIFDRANKIVEEELF